MSQALHIKGAHIWDGDAFVERDLYVQNGRIVKEKPNHALEVDLEGYTLFPGLINAHDHLELNHFPRTKFREVYDNAHQWGEDVNARLNDEPFKTLRSYPLWDKLFIGGLKNLLCGATTVVHHGAPHKPMYRKDFPVRVLKNYGWAHSLHFNTEEEIVHSYQNTPKHYPWFIHLAEGTDEVAAGEFEKAKNIGCLDSERTVAIHVVNWLNSIGLDNDMWVRGFIWCPSTNLYLLAKTLQDNFLFSYPAQNALALGSDSRLTAEGDLLDEIHVAFNLLNCTEIAARFMLQCVFYDAAFILYHVSEKRLIFEQSSADLVAINSTSHDAIAFCNQKRRDLRIIIRDGIPQIGDPDIMAKFPFMQTVACMLDGIEKRINVELARQVHRCKLKEQGLEVDELPQGKRFIFF